MSNNRNTLSRRRFLKSAVGASAVLSFPQIIPSSALGRDGVAAPSERIVMGQIGIGGRGSYDLGIFLEQPEVQFVAACDTRAERRSAAKEKVDEKYGSRDLP